MTSPTSDLQRLLGDVSVLRPQLAARRADLQAERFQQNRKHYYAIDTNIIYFIAQPISKTISQPKLNANIDFDYDDSRPPAPHIGSVFRTDNLRYHLTIGASLAQFISSTLCGNNPLFLPTSLWPEADTMLANFMSLDDPQTLELADQLFDEMMGQVVRASFEQLRPAGVELESLNTPLRRLVRQKVGREEGMARLQNLFRQGKIDELGSRPIRSLAGYRQLGQWQVEQREQERKMFAEWDLALLAVGKSDFGHRRADAAALTQIQLRNLLANRTGSGERILYITLDAQVLLAAQQIRVNYLDCTFAEAFVRHPAAFLNDIGLGVGRPFPAKTMSSDEPASILDWVDVLLAQSSSDRAKLGSTEGAEAAQIIQKRWWELSNIQESQLFVVLGLEEIKKLFDEHAAPGDLNVTIEHLQNAVVENEAEAWRGCFNIAIELALHYNFHSRQKPTRSSPLICFEAWPAAAAAIEQFRLWGSGGIPSRSASRVVIDQLERAEDDTRYAFYLASATFFAARGDWEPAAGLAAFARTTAYRHDPPTRRGANGREANFLEAVARRNLARHCGDLGRASELLHECEKIYSEEKIDWPYPGDVVPERFILEAIDIDQTDFLFRWNDDRIDEGSVATLLERYQALQSRLALQVDRCLSSEFFDPPLGGEEYALVKTEIQTIISMLLVFSTDVIESDYFPDEQVSYLLARLKTLGCASKQEVAERAIACTQDESFLAGLAVKVTSALLAEKVGRRIRRDELQEALKELRSSRRYPHTVFPFDKKRFSTMRAILRRAAHR